MRRPSVEVGAELLGKYAGDGNWYDVIVEAVSTDSARVRFRDYGNSEDVALSDLRAKGDDRDAIIAQLRADLAAATASLNQVSGEMSRRDQPVNDARDGRRAAEALLRTEVGVCIEEARATGLRREALLARRRDRERRRARADADARRERTERARDKQRPEDPCNPGHTA